MSITVSFGTNIVGRPDESGHPWIYLSLSVADPSRPARLTMEFGTGLRAAPPHEAATAS
jgi:hypothetical protein